MNTCKIEKCNVFSIGLILLRIKSLLIVNQIKNANVNTI